MNQHMKNCLNDVAVCLLFPNLLLSTAAERNRCHLLRPKRWVFRDFSVGLPSSLPTFVFLGHEKTASLLLSFLARPSALLILASCVNIKATHSPHMAQLKAPLCTELSMFLKNACFVLSAAIYAGKKKQTTKQNM